MKIAMLCPQAVPPVEGGAERLWRGVVDALGGLEDHEAELVFVPSPESSLVEVVDSYQRFADLDLNAFDMVITGKYPAWMIRHPYHVVYLCHPLRGLYDTYPTGLATVGQAQSEEGKHLLRVLRTAEFGLDHAREEVLGSAQRLVHSLPAEHPDLWFPGPIARELVHWLDADGMHPSRVRRYVAISATVARRPKYFPPSAQVEVAVPPSGLLHVSSDRSGAFFTASRLDSPKRLDLLVDAMRLIDQACELRIAGDGPEAAALIERAKGDSRITFLGRISDDELAAEYAGALAVPFVPYDEDLGLIAIEAHSSAKPVITCVDSGGPTELVTHGVDGWIVGPEPVELAAAMAEALLDRDRTAAMGRAGEARAGRYTWRTVIDCLLGQSVSQGEAMVRRRHVMAFSTYVGWPAMHGGQVRVNRLLTALGERYDVDLVAIGFPASPTCVVAPGVRQTVLEPGDDFGDIESRLTAAIGVPSADLAISLAASERIQAAIRKDFRPPDLVLVEQAFCYPFVRRLGFAAPIIYDAHNAEWSLKRSMYGAGPEAAAAAEAVASIERELVAAATMVLTVSDDDSGLLRQLGPTMADFALLPNGADVASVPLVSYEDRCELRRSFLESTRAAGIVSGAKHVALYVASGHPPNVAAAFRVIAAAAHLPDVLFMMVGSHVSALRGAPIGPNVVARGLVSEDELKLLLSLADVGLNPMADGSGTNIKMLDYLASGTPVVSTEVGARGLPIVPGEHFWMTEDDDLDVVIGSCLSDPGEAHERAKRGRTAIGRFDWVTLGGQMRLLTDAAIFG
jgi:glycosyltransferase involved in cell wall biosynthesis